MNYDEIANNISKDMLAYKTCDESFLELYKICLKKYGNFTSRETNKILTKVIHYITIMGYDIESIKPCSFRYYLN
ncbi:MAG: hypothetical protein IJI49_05060 [Bacilli bacterium]|nr:hypothetical protein [Bacilli bacterium]